MKKVNLLITKRGRDDYLKLVMHNFNLSDNIQDYDLVVYLGEDDKDNLGRIDYSVYKNIQVEHLYTPNLPAAGELFCRGHILNQLLQRMRQDYDWVSIADTDMIYSKSFFSDIANILKEGTNILGDDTHKEKVVIAKGVYSETEQVHQQILANNNNYDFIVNNYPYTDFATNSQVSFTKVYHEKIKQVLRVQSIFDTHSLGHDFIGYGVEDTLVKRILQYSKAEVILLQNAWVHVWHERQAIIPENKKHNKNIMKLMQKEIISRLKEGNYYSNRHLKTTISMIKKFLTQNV